MPKFFSSERFGVPQAIAVFLLLCFFAQCAYFVSQVPLTQLEGAYLLEGIAILSGQTHGGTPHHSPLTALVSVAGIAPYVLGHHAQVDQFSLDRLRWLVRAPFLLAGLLLGASLWYVARRLYGNAGGYCALALYAFSPAMIAHSSLAGPEILGAWACFGLIFTAIATAHTLYAPREVVLWNWKRIVLLGCSIGVAVGAQWSLVWLLVPALAFMFWAVPHRRAAAATIVLAACAVGFVILDVSFGANIPALFKALRNAHWLGLAAPTGVAIVPLASFWLYASTATSVAFVVAIVTFAAWRRPRFFGNLAPLIVALMLTAMGLLLPQSGGAANFFFAMPFFMLFTAGVFADLIESRMPDVPIALIFVLVVGQAVYSIVGLMRVFGGGTR
ncbi:MAG TPA: glycosyltransferase family 39 protein [Candidatus Acidoferrales bacterium]|nr:glycosyltransferase family 39 protein [Candidatus Acidoferrales bacterium]